jgi:ribonucleotide reductase alpha subunit
MTKYVVKRNGVKEKFDISKIANAMHKAYLSVGEEITYEECLEQAKFITKDLLQNGTEISIENIQDCVELYLMDTKKYETAKAYIKYREKQRLDRENPWSDNDERQDMILQKYLLNNESKKDFIKRVAIKRPALEKILRHKEAIFGGRNLYAIGREGNITGSNCYVTEDPEDNLESIYKVDYQIARTYSYGGGQGMNLSKIRPKGAKVNNSSNTTPGVIVFAEKYSHTTLNTQQDNRRGALMLVLNIDHPDIIDFVTTKLDLNKINGANISIALTDDFMNAVEADKDWVMKFETPYEFIEKKLKARQLLELIAYSAHTMGDPGIMFIDKMNDYHFLSEYDEVGLGVMGLADLALSLKLPYGSKEFLDFLDKLMSRMINQATKATALNAKEKGAFPAFDYEKISSSRFYKTVISPEVDELVKKYGMRNSRLLSIAPTGSISNILGVSGGVEPFFQISYTRRIISLFEEEKKITVWEKTPLAMAKTLDILPDDLPEWTKITSQNINFEDRANVQSVIQKYVDTAISSTFNIPNSATVEDVMNIYTTAWKKNLKGATVFRDRCAKIGILSGLNAETKDLNPGVPPKMQKELCPMCHSVLIKKQGCIQCSNDLCDYEKCSI